MLWLWRNWIFWIRFNIMYPLQAILDGIWTSLLTECGSILIWSEFTPSQKEETPIIPLQSSCRESIQRLKTSVTKFTEAWSKISDTLWSGVLQLSSTLKRWEKTMFWKMRISFRLSRKSDKYFLWFKCKHVLFCHSLINSIQI